MSNPTRIPVDLVTRNQTDRLELVVDHAIVAGWTARDRAALERHIAELESLSIPPPASTPIFYPISAARVTTARSIQVLGTGSSGEVEFVLAKIDGRLCVGVGSDHTDREAQAYKISVSKQMCDKPVASSFWLYDEVADHWDDLILRSHAVIDGDRLIYQDGPVTSMLAPEDLLARFESAGHLFGETSLMFCGTLSTEGGLKSATRFDFELVDPKLDRSIAHGYDIETLPVAD